MKLIHRASFALSLLLFFAIVASAQSGKFTVQIVAAPSQAEADATIKELKGKGIDAYILKSQVPGKGTFYRVRAGSFANASDARKYGETLKQQGIVSEFFIAAYERPSPMPAPPHAAETKEVTASTSTPTVKPAEKSVTPAASSATKEPEKSPAPVKTPPKETVTNAGAKTSPEKESTPQPASSSTASVSVVPNFTTFKDSQVGFSFDYPAYWTVNPLTSNAAQAQRVNAGAYFESVDDNAFMNVIWNELEKANNPANNNDLIVDVILTSMKSGKETQSMEVTSRRLEEVKGQIKTYLDLRAKFLLAGQTAPLEFLGKALIVRASKGILLVAMFYSKDAPTHVSGLADKIIATVKLPE
ncbi:MAG: SPOR domain-containing protein [Acidobacteria bacterium]|nr:SPOR domain-containing protein [Acidobacteriota bacterium]